MATPAQILANRLNSQKSTGPRSVEGKAASRFNALKHSASAKSLIIPGEDQSTLEELSASYYERFQPEGPEELLLVEKIVAAHWTQRRMERLETEVFNTLLAQQDDSEKNPLGAAFIKDCQGPKALQKVFRRYEAASREWYRAYNELLNRQADHRQADHIADPPPPPSARPTLPAPAPGSGRPAASHASARLPQAPAPKGETSTPNKIGFVFDQTTPAAWRL